MNYSTNYSMREPVPGEKVKVADINYNTEIIDGVMLDNRQISLEMYRDNETYNKNRVVGHENAQGRIRAYRCLEDGTTGAWDDTKWVQTNISDELEDIRENAGASDLGDLNDVDLTNPTEGQVLTYDEQNDEWVNSDLPDADVTKEASGNPIEFSDGADAPLVKCVTQITGSQDLHGYDKPWVGGAGKNKLNTSSVTPTGSINGINVSVQDDGGIHITGTATQETRFTIDKSYTTLTSGTYVLSMNGATNGVRWISNGSNGFDYTSEYGNFTKVFNVTGNVDIAYIYFDVQNGATVDNTIYIQLESGSTATTFAPYSNICPITAYTEGEIEVSDGDGNATTHTTTYPSAIYRGSEDVVNGSVSYDKLKIVFTGAVDENWSTEESSVGRNFYINISDALPLQYAGTGLLSNIFEASPLGAMRVDKILISNGKNLNVPVGDSLGINTVADWKTWLSTHNLEVVYNTAPTTSSVTPTNLPIKSLSGYNHIESSTGDMDIEYFPAKEQPLIDLIPEASNMHTYSTAEQIVGTWIDGETIYEQTYNYTGTGAANPFTTTIDMTGKHIVEVIPHYARYTYNSGQGYGECIGSEMLYSNSNVLNIRYVDSIPYTLTVSSTLGSTDSYDIAFTLRYTKTSSNNRSLAKSAPQEEQVEELKEEPTEEIKEEPTEEVKEEPEEEVEEVKEEVKEEETKEEGEVNER